ncbi:MAG TPA: helix-turn-helix transcriptional regulator [Streptosporangiaceae bacterium]
MSSFQRAREALGIRLRELRRDARLTGRQLAERNAWHPSKISKIESGKQTPSEPDLEAWARACGQAGLASELIGSLRTLESHYVEHRRLFSAGMSAQQRAFAELEDQTAAVRNFENVFVPGLLQTPEYARYRLLEGIEYDGAPDDLDEAIGARMQRQQILYRSGKRFHFVITEAVLRYRLCPPEVMLGQLDRLVTLSTMPTIRFGVIPFEAALPVAPVHGFWLMDERVVVVENFTASQNLTQAGDIASYAEIFRQLADVAWYESEARSLVTRTLADLTASMGLDQLVRRFPVSAMGS